MNNKIKTYEQLDHQIVEEGYNYGTGVWAYLNPAIFMKLNQYGEYVPETQQKEQQFSTKEVNTLISNTSLLSEINEDYISQELFAKVPGINFDQRIGYYLSLHVGHVLEKNFREHGSSGGFGTWILTELLRNNYVDKVVNVKSVENKDILFEYCIATNASEIEKGAKTKYYPVEMSQVLTFIKNNPGRYAIIGLPTYIMEIRLLAKNDPIIAERIKFCVGLVCGHQKSTNFANFLAWQCGVKPGNIKTVNFRKKLVNSPASQYGFEVTGLIDGEEKTIVKPMKELMGGDWGQGFFKVRASDFTDDVMNETADLTLGDAWLPEYTDDSNGNNILVVRNPIIQKLIEDGLQQGKIKLDDVDTQTIFRSQSSHYRHTHDELSYRLYKKDQQGKWRPKKRVIASKNIPAIRRKIQDKREEITIKAPTYFREAVQKNDLNYFIAKMQPLEKDYRRLYTVQRIQNGIKRRLHIK